MKISAQFSLWGSVVFALFWLFLGVIGIVMAIVSWWMVKGDEGGSAER